MNLIDWYSKLGWSYNPFTFEILPDALVGYEPQLERIIIGIKSGQKIGLVLGPTGSGKTTFLKWLAKNMPEFDSIFLPKPPKEPEELIYILNKYYKTYLWSKIKSIYDIPSFIEKRKKPLIIICDEAHESDKKVLEWLRVLSDQTKNLYLIFAGLPIFENKLISDLETLRKRIAVKVDLLNISKDNTRELIKRRIQYVGGTDISPFSNDALDYIYSKSGGFPREIIRISNELGNKAAELDKELITPEILDKKEEEEKPRLHLDEFSEKQREILELLIQPLTTEEIVDQLGLENFKSKNHGIRAVNNILRRLLELGYVERKRRNRNFVYSLSPKVQTLFVKA